MAKSNITIELVMVKNPDGKNLIFGQSHFIKTVEDLHEALVSAVPGIRFGVAFCEASGVRHIRVTGSDEKMKRLAVENATRVGAGHTFFIFLENAFPINVLSAVKMVSEVVHIFCATANPLEVIIAQTNQGRGVLGVVDGGSPTGVESGAEQSERKIFLRKIGYKL